MKSRMLALTVLALALLALPLSVCEAQWRPLQRLSNANCSNALQASQTCSLANASCSNAVQTVSVKRFTRTALIRQPIVRQRSVTRQVVRQQAAQCTNMLNAGQCGVEQFGIEGCGTEQYSPGGYVMPMVIDLAIPQEIDGQSAHANKTLDAVRAAIQNSDMGQLQKNRLLRRLDRPWVANRVTDEITSRAMAVGLVAVEYDAVSGQAVTNVDWDGLIRFIEQLIPLIVQLIGLFG